MPRFDYLESGPKKKAKKPKVRKATPAPGGRHKGESGERVETVYIRKETLRAVWREVRGDGNPAESVSELVEDLLLAWLRERA
ncbi:hypothetical protein [Deinococcus frigens]|uniref:hypothetical protein n=1 Tax=Deinococcus frigens TaxID=249403 RepID=UPI00049518E5|nr:hypothetical protein [Deinococcus frigens]